MPCSCAPLRLPKRAHRRSPDHRRRVRVDREDLTVARVLRGVVVRVARVCGDYDSAMPSSSVKTAGSGLKIDINGVSSDRGTYRLHYLERARLGTIPLTTPT